MRNSEPNNRVKTIFLDMDGVIVDFHQGILNKYKLDEVSNPFEWDFLYQEDFGISGNEFWLACDDAFWESLDFTKEASEIFEVFHARDLMDRVCLLSKPVAHAFQGKVNWIKNNLSQLYSFNQFLLGKDKNWCAHDGALLIDDNMDHCLQFTEHGGHSFLFPRPWNDRRSLESRAVEELEIFLDINNIRGPNAWKKNTRFGLGD